VALAGQAKTDLTKQLPVIREEAINRRIGAIDSAPALVVRLGCNARLVRFQRYDGEKLAKVTPAVHTPGKLKSAGKQCESESISVAPR
jgi:hypothetical protein